MPTQEGMPFPAKRYGIIYADPPWGYLNKASRGAAADHYHTMGLADILALPVDKLAAEDCVLFLWATFPMLPEALEVIRAWGFRYKTLGFLWVKLNRLQDTPFWGLGNWTRSNPEVCLLAVRGKPRRVSAGIHSVIFSRVGRHSAKPAEARDRIARLLGEVPRIELFARERAPGWDAWGDELEGGEDYVKDP